MRNPDRYTWFGIEKPFPWMLLAWPFLWLYGTLRERIYIRRLTGGWRGQLVAVVPVEIEDGPTYVIGEDLHVGEKEYPLEPLSPWIYSQLLDEWNSHHPASVEIKIGDTDYE